jgi:monofunctional biosynthetic peptidoglycan transglycosylase
VGIFRSVSTLFTILGALVAVAVAWLVPWVFTFHLGTLAYFPYLPKSEQRYLRVTGPWSGPYKKNWVPSEDIPRACKIALVAAEDTKFFIHRGVDLESIEKSYEYNQRKKKPKRGGSTITQQLVKNAFLSRNKSYVRKAREILGAVILDATSSKDMQLTWYFNIVEFGPKIYGIKDASQFYFKKSHKALSTRECASLVAILPSPNRWNKSLKAGAPSGFLVSRIGTIQARMRMIPTDEESSPLVSANRNRKPNRGPTDTQESVSKSRQQQMKQLEIQAEQADELDLPEGPAEAEGQGEGEILAPPNQGLPEQPQSLEILTPSNP